MTRNIGKGELPWDAALKHRSTKCRGEPGRAGRSIEGLHESFGDGLLGDGLMMRKSRAALALLLLFPLSTFSSRLQAQQINTSSLTEMHWRNVGPFRGGRTRAVSGVPSQPNVFYVGAVNGGVWKTTDYGRTWYADLRSAADWLDRSGGGGAVRSEHRLRGQRRRAASS